MRVPRAGQGRPTGSGCGPAAAGASAVSSGAGGGPAGGAPAPAAPPAPSTQAGQAPQAGPPSPYALLNRLRPLLEGCGLDARLLLRFELAFPQLPPDRQLYLSTNLERAAGLGERGLAEQLLNSAAAAQRK